MILSNLNSIWSFVNSTKISLIQSYESKGLRASGGYAQNLEPFVEVSGDGVRYGIKGPAYSEYMEQGRRPNVSQDPESIRRFVGFAGSTFLAKWVRDKGLAINPFAVAYKIAREGIRVPNANNPGGVISDVINEQWFKAGIKVYGDQATAKYGSDVLRSLKLVR